MRYIRKLKPEVKPESPSEGIDEVDSESKHTDSIDAQDKYPRQYVYSENELDTNVIEDKAGFTTEATFDYQKGSMDGVDLDSEIASINARTKLANADIAHLAEGDFHYVKQKYGTCCIVISVMQLFILSIMIAACGVATLKVNFAVGPYPDTLSSWGAINAYQIIERHQHWRHLTASLLHSGVVHLLFNVAALLEAGAFFEREWGSTRWLCIFVVSSVGSSLFTCISDPNSINVGRYDVVANRMHLCINLFLYMFSGLTLSRLTYFYYVAIQSYYLSS